MSDRTPGTVVDLLSRDPPWRFILKAIEIYKQNELSKEGVIVEIGCSRGKINYPLFENSPERDLDLDGHSTSYFASIGDLFYSVDIEISHLEIAKSDAERLFPNNQNCRFRCEDGISFLRGFNIPISFLMLDAWDLNLKNSAEAHLEALKAAMPKMSKKSIILIDDTDVDFDGKQFIWADYGGLLHEKRIDGIDVYRNSWAGKGKLAIPYALENGYNEIILGSNRQTLLVRGYM